MSRRINGTKVECKAQPQCKTEILPGRINGTKVECKVSKTSLNNACALVLMEPKWNVKVVAFKSAAIEAGY